LFQRGTALLEAKDFNAAQIPLEQARELEPDKSSIREALGRAYWHSGRYAQARDEFAAVVQRHPVHDFAHLCLRRSPPQTGALRGAALVLRANQKWAPFPNNDPDAARALMTSFYELLKESENSAIDPRRAAELEVEWWRAHRDAQHPERGGSQAGLIEALADL